MVQIAKHRVNDSEQIELLPLGVGAEIDLRSNGKQIILTHDWNGRGDTLDLYLDRWRHKRGGTLILNTKEDGLEDTVLEMLRKREIEDYFFLDLSFPTLVKLAVKARNPRVALRLSEYESLDSAILLRGLVNWVWIDSFTGIPPKLETITEARKHFKTCLVSPELQGFSKDLIDAYRSLIPQLDLVCTKFPESWSA